jgi:hypothetical protein
MMEYIEFRLAAKQNPKTQVWNVVSKKRGDIIGVIKWDGRWRQYTFFPATKTTWSHDCLVDVIVFLRKLKEKRAKP